MAKLLALKMEKANLILSSDSTLQKTLSKHLKTEEENLTQFDKMTDKIYPMQVCKNNDIIHCLAIFEYETNILVNITYATSDPTLEGQVNHMMRTFANEFMVRFATWYITLETGELESLPKNFLSHVKAKLASLC